MPNTRNLPIDAHRDEITRAIGAHQVTVIHGETGSGKSTRLPQYCLAMGRGADGLIGHTQPRRVAARSVAARIAEELGEALGRAVGYQIRFTRQAGPKTRIKLMTDGILLAEIQGDRKLRAYDTLIIDEAHERSLDIDFILGYLKKLLPKRPDLKLILASATIDPERFSRHFQDAPIITVSGRTFPVEVRYRPLETEEDDNKDASSQDAFDRKSTRNRASMPIPDAVTDAIEEIYREPGKPDAEGSEPSEPDSARPRPGKSKHRDILVFLVGEQEIRETAEILHKRHLPNTEVLPLFGRLGSASQDRIFAPHTRRHVILATNIAETSLTVPGIGFVVDAGYARISRYSYRAKVQRLPIEPVSRASADQRKGRSGRIAPGVCIRLYSRESFAARPEFTEPEILRTNLATVILRMKALGFGEVERFPFLDMPDRRYISDGYRLLRELGATDAQGKLTKRGRQLAKLPVDPRIGCMILAGAAERCLDEILIIASALSIPDPREYPRNAAKGARDAGADPRERFRDGRSDFMELLRIWAYYQERVEQLSANQLRKRCRKYSLSYLRMREWREVHRQLRARVREMKLSSAGKPATYARIHRALLAGLLGHIGQDTPEQEYLGARNSRFLIGRESTLRGARPKWVMAAELIQTSRTYAHNAARIRPEWIERVGSDLLKKDYFDSYWDAARGEIMIRERVTLYGLTIIPGRNIPYAVINHEEARRLFIDAALVEGCYATDNGISEGKFFVHNRALLTDLRKWEHRCRQPGAFVDERALGRFYDERIPQEVAGGRAFEAWRRQAERAAPKRLFLSPEHLCDPRGLARIRERFPDRLRAQGQHLRLEYRFEPGDQSVDSRDGVTVTIAQSALYQLEPGPFQWLIPGLLEEKILLLLRTLPKPLRRALPPLADTARACFLETAFGPMVDSGEDARGSDSERRRGVPLVYPKEALVTVLGELLRRMTGIAIPADAWQERHLPPYLRMNFRVIDSEGVTLRAGRDLARIQQELAPDTSPILPKLPHARKNGHGQDTDDFHRDGITDWDFPDLPNTVEIATRDARFPAYPAIIDHGQSVSLRLVDSSMRAEELTRAGLCRLFMLGLKREMRYLHKNLPDIQRLCVAYAALPAPAAEKPAMGACQELREHLAGCIVQQTFLDDKAPIRTRAAFQAAKEQRATNLMIAANAICQAVGRVLVEYRAVVSLRSAIDARAFPDSLADITDQLDKLVFRGFVRATPAHQLPHLPRYLQAIARRLEKLRQAPDKDRRNMGELLSLQRAHGALASADAGRLASDLARLRWLLEELRVSLFAQELGTTQPVSAKRLYRQLERLPG
uniref:ATP-dependent helicase HrpA n=1 Tax=Candidatus Kentrum sp. LPFa TaxID=2126335 RepID=A0A450XV36_9GAMM|nr:MAG: ATP-dependent helicase HrpA [Candidatus Kentron sp. LPFa]VFK33150.1 MAG: ATP-dependent helicase HrpA [Candidatus Kentron sp. LPFa]